MDTDRFDSIATTLASSPDRRGILQIIGAAALSIGGIGFLAQDESDARKRKKKRKKGKRKGKNKGKGNGNNGKNNGNNNERCFNAGDSCSFDDQCCTKTTNRICDVPHGAGSSDKACCGGQGAVCGGVDANGDQIGPFCCAGSAGVRAFVCSQSDPNNPNVQGTCIPAPVE